MFIGSAQTSVVRERTTTEPATRNSKIEDDRKAVRRILDQSKPFDSVVQSFLVAGGQRIRIEILQMDLVFCSVVQGL